MTTKNEFYLTLASDESDSYFDLGIQKSEFTNKLAHAIVFKEKYEVALTEIYIPSFQIPTNENRKKRRSQFENSSRKRRAVGEPTEDRMRGLSIKLPDFDWEIVMSPTQLNDKLNAEGNRTPFSATGYMRLQEVVAEFSQHILFHTKPDLSNDVVVNALLNKLLAKIREDCSSIDLVQEQRVQSVSSIFPHVLPISIPTTAPTGYTYVLAELKQYPNFQSFLAELFIQVPPALRDMDFVLSQLSHLNSKHALQELVGLRAVLKDGLKYSLEHQNEIIEDKKQIEESEQKPAESSTPNESSRSKKSEGVPSIVEIETNETLNQNSSHQSSGTIEDHSQLESETTHFSHLKEQLNQINTTLTSIDAQLKKKEKEEQEKNKNRMKNSSQTEESSSQQIDPTVRGTLDDIEVTPYSELEGFDLHMIFVYADIVEPHMYANRMLRLLYANRAGLGNYFNRAFSFLLPQFRSGIKAVKNQAKTSIGNIVNQLGEKDLKSILQNESQQAIKNLSKQAINKLSSQSKQSELQTGEGKMPVGLSALQLYRLQNILQKKKERKKE